MDTFDSRRSFLKHGTLGTLAAGLGGTAGQTANTAVDPGKVLNYNSGMKYRRLGDTDLYVSLISMGGLVMVEPVYHYAIERGMNFIDTSPSYRGGLAIKQLGNVLKTRRDKVYVGCKYHSYVRFEENLRDLKTDHLDFIVFNHHDRGSARDDDDLEVYEKFRKTGKVRFAALMTHGDVKEVTAIGIRKGLYRFIAPGMNEAGLDFLRDEIRAAQQKGIGIVAMKALRGMDDRLQPAYIKKLAANPAISSVLLSIGSYEVFDTLRKALHEPITAAESRALSAHLAANRTGQCVMCDACKRACPQGVEVSTLLRCHDYYYAQKRDVPAARAAYHAIPREKVGGPECRTCGRCEAVCPNSVRIVPRIESARATFERMVPA